MSYLKFLAQWYNWPYLAAVVLTAMSFVWPGNIRGVGNGLAGLLRLRRVGGHSVIRVFGITLGVTGLTVNGALHDYWPPAQQSGFLPGLALSVMVAILVTRSVGRIQERYFPEIKAVGFDARDLAGSEGRVVSRSVGPSYLAGRAQVMGDDGTLHIVLCKTGAEDIPYGSRIVLGEYDDGDGRYYARRAGQADTSESAELASGQDRG